MQETQDKLLQDVVQGRQSERGCQRVSGHETFSSDFLGEDHEEDTKRFRPIDSLVNKSKIKEAI